jgi:membrane-associated phospholipid phosphatase
MKLTRWGWCASLGIVGFLALACAAAQGWLFGLDHAVMDWVAAQRDCEVIRAAAALSVLGAGETSLLLTGVAAAIWLARRRFHAAAGLLLLYISLPVEIFLKFALIQPGPGEPYAIPESCEWYRPLLFMETPNSFPSGYAIRVTYFLALVAIGLLATRATGSRAVLLALSSVMLTGLLASRLVVSWHWPSDLVAGALLGFGLAAATQAVAASDK